MIENIINLDQTFFHFINTNLSNPFTDVVMPVVTHMSFWMLFFGIFCLYQIWQAYKKREYHGILCILSVLVGIIICDQISSHLIKELVQRPRPCHSFTDINLLVSCGGGKSFPSSHASNSMMAVVVIVLFYRRHKYWLPLISILVGISRIFVGVHYPFDVLVGWILGLGIGVGVYFLMQYLYRVYMVRQDRRIR